MSLDFSFDEVRVLGVLMEKEMATPEYYPLTLNSLTTGCNQKSNRDPVVDFSQSVVMAALDSLMRRRLVGHASGAGSRAEKFRHALSAAWDLSEAELAALALLFLRGPQTVGEIRGRSGRLFAFESLDQVSETLTTLQERPEPLVTELPRQPGQKEARFVHLLMGEPDPADFQVDSPAPVAQSSLRTEVDELKERLEALEKAFATFRSQFE